MDNNNINNCMSKTKQISEKQDIVNFLKAISQKKYSEANKYLQSAIDLKVKSKINNALKQNIF